MARSLKYPNRIMVRFSNGTDQALKLLADRNGMPKANLVRQITEDHIRDMIGLSEAKIGQNITFDFSDFEITLEVVNIKEGKT